MTNTYQLRKGRKILTPYSINIENKYDTANESVDVFFESKEEKDEYYKKECAFCRDELQDYASAFTKAERIVTGTELYRARLNFLRQHELNKKDKDGVLEL